MKTTQELVRDFSEADLGDFLDINPVEVHALRCGDQELTSEQRGYILAWRRIMPPKRPKWTDYHRARKYRMKWLRDRDNEELFAIYENYESRLHASLYFKMLAVTEPKIKRLYRDIYPEFFCDDEDDE